MWEDRNSFGHGATKYQTWHFGAEALIDAEPHGKVVLNRSQRHLLLPTTTTILHIYPLSDNRQHSLDSFWYFHYERCGHFEIAVMLFFADKHSFLRAQRWEMHCTPLYILRLLTTYVRRRCSCCCTGTTERRSGLANGYEYHAQECWKTPAEYWESGDQRSWYA